MARIIRGPVCHVVSPVYIKNDAWSPKFAWPHAKAGTSDGSMEISIVFIGDLS